VDCRDGLVPIVRTTTPYQKPAQVFRPIHREIIDNVKKRSLAVTALAAAVPAVSQRSDANAEHPDPTAINLDFNNALIELYDSQYRNMKFHSDQSLDLAQGSFICIFSCYDIPDTPLVRKLKIQNKITRESSEISMDHNSFVLFSLETNGKHLHKIVLEGSAGAVPATAGPGNGPKWLGITFRLSKTFVRFCDDVPIMHPGACILRMATKDEFREFLKKRGEENKSVGFTYPFFDYTISASDRLPPTQTSGLR